MKRTTKRKMNKIMQDIMFVIAMFLVLTGGVYTTAGVIIINQMDQPTPTWNGIQHVVKRLKNFK